jgi:ABC-2 type transport system ATP-binding protein
VLVVDGVQKRHGDVAALKGVTFSVAAGEILAVLGPNGAGKSTLMSLVAGLLSPDTGSLRVAGFDVQRQPRDARRNLGLAPQELGLYSPLTARDNLDFFARMVGLSRSQARVRTSELAAALGLEHLLDRRVQHLSTGEARRVHTAVALLHRPPLVLLDEPTANADVETRNQILELVRHLAATDTAVCYCTHYLAEVESLAARVLILDDGQVLATGSLADLLSEFALPIIELVFDGPAPTLAFDRASATGDTLRIAVEDPAAMIGHVLGSLGTHVRRLRSAEVIKPSLEHVYMSTTGRRYREEVGNGVSGSYVGSGAQ